MTESKEIRSEILKVDDELGIVFGWGIVCELDGEPYFDTQDDYISESEMLAASADFMVKSREMDANHQRVQTGDVVFAMPMTKDVAAAYNMELPRNNDGQTVSGFMLAVKPHDDAELAKFKDGTYTGFSLEGMAIRERVDG